MNVNRLPESSYLQKKIRCAWMYGVRKFWVGKLSSSAKFVSSASGNEATRCRLLVSPLRLLRCPAATFEYAFGKGNFT